jgi:hypothetical protein
MRSDTVAQMNEECIIMRPYPFTIDNRESPYCPRCDKLHLGRCDGADVEAVAEFLKRTGLDSPES